MSLEVIGRLMRIVRIDNSSNFDPKHFEKNDDESRIENFK